MRKYAKGFDGVIVVVPTTDIPRFLHLESSFQDIKVKIKGFLEYPGKGFVHHLAMKCYADVLCPQATHILHMDPDCLFSAHITPDSYFVDGKPVLLIEPYEAFKEKHPGRYNWKQVTEKAVGFPCSHETMCRHPAVHNAETYGACRSHIQSIHETPFIDFVLKQENKFPQGFGEFNTLGSFALEMRRGEYHFIDRGFEGEKHDPASCVTQLWSYTGVRRPDNLETIRRILN